MDKGFYEGQNITRFVGSKFKDTREKSYCLIRGKCRKIKEKIMDIIKRRKEKQLCPDNVIVRFGISLTWLEVHSFEVIEGSLTS